MYRTLAVWVSSLLVAQIGYCQADGTLDTTFHVGSGFRGGAVLAIKLQPDGKMLMGGIFFSYNGTAQSNICRVHINGTLDTSFRIGDGIHGSVYALALQPDGKVIAAGFFTRYRGTPRNSIVRINPDGSLDNRFDPGVGFDRQLYALALQPDGKVIAGGDFGSYNREPHKNLIRLNTDGSVDTSFHLGAGFQNLVKSLALQPDGRLLVGGLFDTVDGNVQHRVVRLHPDGRIDTSFHLPVAFNAGDGGGVEALAIQPNGKILLPHRPITSQNQNYIARLMPNGAPDTTYTAGMSYQGSVGAGSFALQPDGKLLVGGFFTIDSLHGMPRRYLMRLNADGGVDTTLSLAGGFNNAVYAIAVQPDGKILAGGSFTNYQGIASRDIARLNNTVTTETKRPLVENLQLYPNPAHHTATLKSGQTMRRVHIINATGKVVAGYTCDSRQTTLSVADLPIGIYLVEAEMINGTPLRQRLTVK